MCAIWTHTAAMSNGTGFAHQKQTNADPAMEAVAKHTGIQDATTNSSNSAFAQKMSIAALSCGMTCVCKKSKILDVASALHQPVATACADKMKIALPARRTAETAAETGIVTMNWEKPVKVVLKIVVHAQAKNRAAYPTKALDVMTQQWKHVFAHKILRAASSTGINHVLLWQTSAVPATEIVATRTTIQAAMMKKSNSAFVPLL